MSSKFLLLFLSTFLLVQSSLGKSLTTTFESDSSEVPDTPSVKILLYVVTEFSELADSTLNTGKKLFQDVIADISAQDNKNEQVTAKLDEYSKLVTKIEKLQTTNSAESSVESFTAKFEFVGELCDRLNKLDASSIKKPTSVEKLFYESLKKNGLSNLEKHFEDKFETFVKGFNETAASVLNSVTTEEWPEKTKMQDLLKNFNTEKEADKKIHLLEKFLEFLK